MAKRRTKKQKQRSRMVSVLREAQKPKGSIFRIDPLTGISEYDMKDLFQLPPDGCQRRLFYQKINAPEDAFLAIDEKTRKKEWTYFTAQDFLLTSLCLLRYNEGLNRKARKNNMDWRGRRQFMIAKCPAYWLRNVKQAVPLLITHLDDVDYFRLMNAPDTEITLQMQHTLSVRELPYMAFGGISFNYLPVVHYEIEADPAIQARIVEKCQDFWALKEKEEPPDKYDPSHRACLFCTYRVTCHGEKYRTRASALDDHIKRYITIQEEIERLTIANTLAEQAIFNKLTDQKAESLWGKISVTTRSRVVIDQDRMFKEHPGLKKEYGVAKPINKLNFVPWGG